MSDPNPYWYFLVFQAFYENNFVEKGQLESYKQELEAKVCGQ